MAEHVMGSLNASLAKRKAEKYSPELESEIRNWLALQLEDERFKDVNEPLHILLKDGVLLCTFVYFIFLCFL